MQFINPQKIENINNKEFNDLNIKICIPDMPIKDVIYNRNNFLLLFHKLLSDKSIILQNHTINSNKNSYLIIGQIKAEEYLVVKGPKINSNNVENFKKQFNSKNVTFFEENNIIYAKVKQENLHLQIINILIETILKHSWSIKMFWNTDMSCVRPIKHISLNINNTFYNGKYHSINFIEDNSQIIDYTEILKNLEKDYEIIVSQSNFHTDMNKICKINAVNLINPKIVTVEINEKFYKLPERMIEYFLVDNHDSGLMKINNKYHAIYFLEKNINIDVNVLKITFESKLIDALYLFNIDINRSIDFYINKNKNKKFFQYQLSEKCYGVYQIAKEIVLLNNLNVSIPFLKEISIHYKLDVCSETISEFPSLEGLITEQILDDKNLASVINEIHSEPKSIEAILIYISDKIYNLSHLSEFLPTGDGDPCGLKSDTNNIIMYLIKQNLKVNMEIFEKSRLFFEKRYLSYLYNLNKNLKLLKLDIQLIKNYLNIDLNINIIERVKKLISKGDFNQSIELTETEQKLLAKCETLILDNYNDISVEISNYLDNTIINPFKERKEILDKFIQSSNNFLIF